MKVLFSKIVLLFIVTVIGITLIFPVISYAEENEEIIFNPPTIVEVNLGSQNELYKKGDAIIVNIKFNKIVMCNPEISVFEISMPTVPAISNKVLEYKEGNGTDTLSYQYIVDDNLDYKGNIILFSIMGSYENDGNKYIYPSIHDEMNFPCEKIENTIISEVNIDSQKPIIHQMSVYAQDYPSDSYAKEYNVEVYFEERSYENPTAEARYFWSTDSNPLSNKSDYKEIHEFLVEDNSNNYHNISIPSNKLGNVEGTFYLHV
ncbi:hypothetical protein, partial [Vallitalea guaymasensis]|uniref:hypothetical protein n=1 Tax=Vallitalea guaymasensis TaxID=1185412 RepID=UPI00272CFB12